VIGGVGVAGACSIVKLMVSRVTPSSSGVRAVQNAW
jgi:hypothetical protein